MWKSNRCRSSTSTPERQYFTMGRHAAVPNATTTQQSSSTTANRSDNATKPEHHPLSTLQNVPMYIPACAQPFGKLVILAQALSLKSCWGEPTHTHTHCQIRQKRREKERSGEKNVVWTPQGACRFLIKGACPFVISAPQGAAMQVQEDNQSSLPMPLLASLDTIPVTCCVPLH